MTWHRSILNGGWSLAEKEHMEQFCAKRRESEVRRPPRSRRAGCFVGVRAERGWRENIRQPNRRQSLWELWRSAQRKP